MNTVQPRGGSARAGVFFWRWDAGKDGRERRVSVRTVVGGDERRRWAFVTGIRASEYQGKAGTYVGRYGCR